MEKNYFGAIEFGSLYNSVVIVSYHNNKIDVVAASRVRSAGFYDGRIVDEEAFNTSLAETLKDVYDKYKINLDEVILVLPNNNHKVYEANVTNKILTERQIISKAEINAIRKQVRSAKINENELLVEEIPALFTLEGDRSLRSDPINYQSSFLTIISYVHTLPKDIVENLKSAMTRNNISVIGSYINCSCGACATKQDYELEDETLCINIGQEVTTIGAYKQSLLTHSTRVNFGVETLVKHLAKTLQIDLNKAMELFETYFIADVDYASDVVFEELNDTTEGKLFEKRISGIILNRLSNGISEIVNRCKDLVAESRFSEEHSYHLEGWLNDYEFFADEFSKYVNKPLKERNIDIIGLNYQSYLNCYGALKLFIERNKQYIIKRLENDESLDVNKKVNTFVKNEETKQNISTGKFKDIFDD